MPKELLTWLPLATLFAALAGPLVAYIVGVRTVATGLRNAQSQINTSLNIARLQIHSSTVSSNRQKWIDTLRDELAEFLAERDALTAKLRDSERDQTSVRTSSTRLVRLFHQLQLRLNPKEADHARIISLVDDLSRKPTNELDDSMIDELVALAQSVLKREWERVKQGD